MTDAEVEECLRQLRGTHDQVIAAQIRRDALKQRLDSAGIAWQFKVEGVTWKRSWTYRGEQASDPTVEASRNE